MLPELLRIVVDAVVVAGVPFVELQNVQQISKDLKCFLTKMCISTTVKMILATLRIAPIRILAMCGSTLSLYLVRKEDKSFPNFVSEAWTKWRQPSKSR